LEPSGIPLGSVLKDPAFNLKASDLVKVAMIGKGAYGEVHQGLLAKDGVYIGVAIKQLTAHGSIEQLLHEAVCTAPR
jgi:hypothetical protein